MTSKVTYLGELRTEATHLASGNVILSDAPIDNNGKGEAFSPTDTVATALASCAMTIMGIKAASMDWDIKGITADVTKEMSADPRRIAKVSVVFHVPFKTDEKQRKILEQTAKTCPVYMSLHPDIVKDFQFDWA
ncbi:OsmC family peroxiredoxin [Ornithobacterium rhinotracheale]|uniref:OsmC family protein n=1 Tax=Ornithobacterium rhinotracheale TaxID=28251 RepID=UPI00129C5947|nr:OsmC family protein [Ornithobacterium rhinotracheale]MRJ08659.1 OsmC family peroxiredoxin [Ornithobacterium rhinotracheale]MRJ10992.1 OsmC family peroxiredoxin [Ornithobacterium rhinotracheale]UOH76895.1 OsmC family protein [Ornithobacterium rhinotracheale]